MKTIDGLISERDECEERCTRLASQVAALTAERERLREALGDILDVAERERAGYGVGIEDWYARRDAARIVLEDTATTPALATAQEPR